MSLRRNISGFVLRARSLIWLSLCALLCEFPKPAVAQSLQPPPVQELLAGTLDPSETGASADERQPERQLPGYINGTVIDQIGAVAVDAQVRLTSEDQSRIQEVLSGENGQFFFADVHPGSFLLTIIAEGFETQRVSGALRPGETYLVPAIRLAVAPVVTEVRVVDRLTPVEMAQT